MAPQFLDVRAVIVDDDSIARTALRAMLRSFGIRVVGETSLGRRAVEMIPMLEPDLVFLDVGLPDINGTAVLGEVCGERSLKSPRVVMVTADARPDQVRTTLAKGAVGYVVKPYTEATLKSTMRRLFPGKAFEDS